MTPMENLRSRAEATQATLARLADALGTLEAEERQLSATVQAAGLDTPPLELATKQARLGQLQRAIAEQRPIVDRARTDASTAANALDHAERQLASAQRDLALLRECEHPSVTRYTINDWRILQGRTAQLIRDLSGETPPELLTRPPLPEVDLV